jgi:hypothetical protein
VPRTLASNYREMLGSCVTVEFALAEDIAKWEADRVLVAAEQLRHLHPAGYADSSSYVTCRSPAPSAGRRVRVRQLTAACVRVIPGHRMSSQSRIPARDLTVSVHSGVPDRAKSFVPGQPKAKPPS